MVGVNSYNRRFGTVAIFATLFAAIQFTSGERGCTFDFENLSDFELGCNSEKNSWIAKEDVKDSPNKKVLTLTPEEEGCLKTKHPITLNSTSPVIFKFYSGASDENAKMTLRLLPKEGSCPDDECVWNVGSDPQFKVGEWVIAEHKFPLKSMKEYDVQLQVGKSKGKLLVDSISFPNAYGDSRICRSAADSMKAVEEAGISKINKPDKFVAVEGETAAPAAGGGGGGSKKSFSPSLADFSKNLLLTSASLLTLNNILN